jgi:uncharacterized protein YggU (UPF0235/DUF167 family)
MIIKVNAKPGAKEEKVERISAEEYNVWLKERAEDGKANKRLLNLLAREFGVSFRDIKIKNPKSRKKIVEITSCQSC